MQNLMLVGQALGIGGWIHGSVFHLTSTRLIRERLVWAGLPNDGTKKLKPTSAGSSLAT